MTDPSWPTSWDEEPWPLEDPSPGPGLNPTSWSDSLAPAQVPQPGELADEAWRRAEDRGISMERALAELQQERAGFALAGRALGARMQGPHYSMAVSAAGVVYSRVPGWQQAVHAAQEAELRRRAEEARDAFADAAHRVAEVFAQVDWSQLADQIKDLASAFDDPGMAGAAERRSAIRFCPRHGPMAKGGFCRRCGR